MESYRKSLLIAHIVLSLAVFTFLALLWLHPDRSLASYGMRGPATNIHSLVASLFLLWVLASVVVAALALRKVDRSNLIFFVSGVVLSLLYLGILREHVVFGDYNDYLNAAESVLADERLPERYLYPPLWAMFLARSILVIGRDGTTVALFVLNHLSLLGFFVLAALFLKRFGLSLNLSGLLVLASLLASAPVVRNMVYVQVNFLVIDLVLLSLLFSSKSTLASASALAVGVHLKVLPIVFTPLFIAAKRWSWIVYFVIAGALLAAATIFLDGQSYYGDFRRNLQDWEPTALRSCSVRSFLDIAQRNHFDWLPSRALATVASVPMIGMCYFLALRSTRGSTLAGNGSRDDALLRASVPLFFLFVVVPPAVWPHHLVAIILPTLLTLLRLRTGFELAAFTLGYFLTFLMPVLDLWPWSFLRLAGWLILAALMARVVLAQRGFAGWVHSLQSGLDAVLPRVDRAT